MVERAGRTSICSIVFMDIVGYSKLPDSQQLVAKVRLNGIMDESIRSIAETERIVLDTGDGAALCFFGNPEDAILVASAVNDAFHSDPAGSSLTMRTGVNLGPVKVVTDLNHHPNLLGDGINVAQRIMSFAAEGEILVSRSYYEVVARLREGNERLFHYLGTKKDKHVRVHQVYAFDPGSQPAGPESGEFDVERAPLTRGGVEHGGADAGPPSLLTAEAALAVERSLTNYIGPLGKVMVARAVRSAKSIDDFYNALAALIPDQADRAEFRAGLAAGGGPLAAPVEGGQAWPEIPAGADEALTQDNLRLAEQRLAQQIGPLARILVRNAARDAVGLRDLYHKLADDIPDHANRETFLASLDMGQ